MVTEQSIIEFRRILERIWYSGSKGQCYSTCLLVQNVLGGKILYGDYNGQRHYWNMIDTKQYDLTSDQFGGDGIHAIEIPFKVRYNPNYENEKYLRLREAYRAINQPVRE